MKTRKMPRIEHSPIPEFEEEKTDEIEDLEDESIYGLDGGIAVENF